MGIKQKRMTGSIRKTVILNPDLLGDLRGLIINARERVAQQINSELVLLYWNIGRRIRQDVLKERRADYGEQIVSALSSQLRLEFGPGFSDKNIRHMMRFAEVFPDGQIVSALRRQLGWTHFKMIIYLDDPLKRSFYTEMCRIERWSTRTLENKINHCLYERTAVARKPRVLIEHEIRSLRESDKLTPDLVFRDPYFLDFLRLRDGFIEKDIEDAIMREMEEFILELGDGFTFVSRQKRITVDDEDYYLDLLFYHRKLKRLVAIDLKLGKFQASYKGQMELYLRWLDKYERQKGEEEPIGLILCAGKSDHHVQLLELDKGNIRVAAYMTDLPAKELLEKKLMESLTIARERMHRKHLAEKSQ